MWQWAQAPVLRMNLGFSMAEIDLGDRPLYDPFPAAWPRYVVASCAYAVDFESGVMTFPEVVTVVPAGATVEARPLVGPPRNLRVDGRDATLDGDVPLWLTLSWDPPAIGEPTAYEVALGRVDTYDEHQFAIPDTWLHTKGTELVVPYGSLGWGERYVISVAAIVTPVDLTVSPQRFAAPYGRAEAVTGVLTVR